MILAHFSNILCCCHGDQAGDDNGDDDEEVKSNCTAEVFFYNPLFCCDGDKEKVGCRQLCIERK